MMGGSGSGREKYSDRLLTSDCHRLSMSDLTQSGQLEIDLCSRSHFFLKPPGIYVRLERDGGDGLTLVFRMQAIKLSSTAANFGGSRWFFLCPGCGARRATLYARPAELVFLCRVCQDLAYYSSRDRIPAFFVRTMIEGGWPSAAAARRAVREYIRARRKRTQPARRWVRRRDRPVVGR